MSDTPQTPAVRTEQRPQAQRPFGGQGQQSGDRGPNAGPNNSSYQRDKDARRNNLRNKRDFSKRKGGPRGPKKPRDGEDSNLESKVILVRRVTRVVKGGKRMRFSALVVVGDKEGKVGFGLRKGLDYQDAVAKATRKAKNSLIDVSLNTDFSVDFASYTKHESCELYIKPARIGTGIIAGGFLRPVLELAGIKNIYSKITRSRNKIAGTQAAFAALKKYSK
jgi:small subunit ribosomal protein S5